MHMRSVDPEQVRNAARDRHVNLVDVRTPAEYAVVHAAGAVNIPLDELDASKVAHLDPGEPIYIICKSGARAAKAIHKLHAAGYRNLVNVHGGTDAWVAAGLPHLRGRDAISVDRQVRIAAGSLTALGVLIALWQPAAGLAIAGLVGAGQVYSGASDTCAMGSVLARMPWNRKGRESRPTPAAS